MKLPMKEIYSMDGEISVVKNLPDVFGKQLAEEDIRDMEKPI